MSDTVAIAPLPHYYAAIRMDPVSMAKDLGLDDVAVAEAEELAKRTKKYLVYMFQVSMHPRPLSPRLSAQVPMCHSLQSSRFPPAGGVATTSSPSGPRCARLTTREGSPRTW